MSDAGSSRYCEGANIGDIRVYIRLRRRSKFEVSISTQSVREILIMSKNQARIAFRTTGASSRVANK